jgi:hypothetical protein
MDGTSMPYWAGVYRGAVKLSTPAALLAPSQPDDDEASACAGLGADAEADAPAHLQTPEQAKLKGGRRPGIGCLGAAPIEEKEARSRSSACALVLPCSCPHAAQFSVMMDASHDLIRPSAEGYADRHATGRRTK